MTQIAFVTYPGVTALDLVGPYEVLRHLPDADIRFVWHETGPIATDSNVLLLGATHTFGETPNPDIVVVPGGTPTVAVHARDQALLEWLRAVDTTSQWTTSVCAGSVILGAAGLLDGRRATSHWQALPLLRTFGATPVGDERIVHDEIVTAAGVSAGIDLALWLFARVADENRAKAVQLAIEYDPQPPFDSGSTAKASRSVIALATAGLLRESANPRQLAAAGGLLWDQAINRSRARRRRLGSRSPARTR